MGGADEVAHAVLSQIHGAERAAAAGATSARQEASDGEH
jgi:hypothetical protein